MCGSYMVHTRFGMMLEKVGLLAALWPPYILTKETVIGRKHFLETTGKTQS